MFNQIKDSVFLIIGAAFAVFGIYEIAVPVSEEIVTQFAAALFALLGAILIGYNARANWVKSFILANSIQAINFDRLKSAGAVVISLVFGLLGIWGITSPVSEEIVLQLFALIIIVLSGAFGGVNTKDFLMSK